MNFLRPVIIVLFIAGAILHYAYFSYTADDAFITFRFARNWAHGFGVVFNPGQPPVEGYTNFLWLGWLSLHYRLGFTDLELVAKLWGLLFGILSILVVANAAKPVVNLRSCAGMGLLVFSAPFCFWIGAGMETALFSFLLVSLVAKITSPSDRQPNHPAGWLLIGGGFALLALTRPEGVWLTVMTAAALLIRRAKGMRKACLCLSIGFLLPYLPYFLWRFSYYGDLAPNTFYAKSGDWWVLFRSGVRYLGDFGKSYGLTLLPLLSVIRSRKKLGFCELYPLSVIAAYLLYIVWIGGDFMPYFRFFAPVYPVLALLYVKLAMVSERDRPAWYKTIDPLVIIGLAAVALWPSLSGAEYKQYRYEQNELFPRWTIIGKVLGDKFPVTTTIACTAVGRIPYYSNLPTLDMLGLNDKHIARQPVRFSAETRWHEKHDSNYVLAQHPDILLVSNGLVTMQPSVDFKATAQEIGLFEDRQRFDSLYQPVNIVLPDGRYLAFFIAKKRPTS